MSTRLKEVDLVKVAEHPAAVIGMTGSGKTYTVKGIVERLLELDRRVVIIDPTGAWFGLRSGADGSKSGGFPVLIFGGDHADVPLLPEAGVQVAEMLADRHVQCILDVSDMTGGERSRFMAAFLETMFIKNRTHLHLVVDEADDICPQKPMPGQERMKGAFDKVVRKGRRRGFIPLMITQRPAVIDKSVLSQSAAMIIMKLMSPQDQAAIKGWVEGNVEMKNESIALLSSLSSLQRGVGWVWAPSEGIKQKFTFPKIRTFDSSRTPSIGEEIKPPVLSEVDVRAIMKDMEEMAAKSAAKPTKPDAPAGVDIKAISAEAYERGRAEAIRQGAVAIQALTDWMVKRVGDFQDEIREQFDNLYAEARLPDRFSVPVDQIVASKIEATSTDKIDASKIRGSSSDKIPLSKLRVGRSSDLTPTLQRTIDAVMWWHVKGFSTVDRKHVAIMCGLSPSASTIGVYISKLRDKGYINTEVGEPGHIALTDAGREIAVADTSSTVLQSARDILKGQARRAFDIVVAAYPKPIARNEIADTMNLSRTASTVGVYISKGMALGLIENHGQGMVRAADFLFR
jgi:hypothetical protein